MDLEESDINLAGFKSRCLFNCVLYGAVAKVTISSFTYTPLYIRYAPATFNKCCIKWADYCLKHFKLVFAWAMARRQMLMNILHAAIVGRPPAGTEPFYKVMRRNKKLDIRILTCKHWEKVMLIWLHPERMDIIEQQWKHLKIVQQSRHSGLKW